MTFIMKLLTRDKGYKIAVVTAKTTDDARTLISEHPDYKHIHRDAWEPIPCYEEVTPVI